MRWRRLQTVSFAWMVQGLHAYCSSWLNYWVAEVVITWPLCYNFQVVSFGDAYYFVYSLELYIFMNYLQMTSFLFVLFPPFVSANVMRLHVYATWSVWYVLWFCKSSLQYASCKWKLGFEQSLCVASYFPLSHLLRQEKTCWYWFWNSPLFPYIMQLCFCGM